MCTTNCKYSGCKFRAICSVTPLRCLADNSVSSVNGIDCPIWNTKLPSDELFNVDDIEDDGDDAPNHDNTSPDYVHTQCDTCLSCVKYGTFCTEFEGCYNSTLGTLPTNYAAPIIVLYMVHGNMQNH